MELGVGTQGEHRHFPRVCRDETKKPKPLTRAKLEKDMRYNKGFCVGILAREGKARKMCEREGNERIKFKSNFF